MLICHWHVSCQCMHIRICVCYVCMYIRMYACKYVYGHVYAHLRAQYAMDANGHEGRSRARRRQRTDRWAGGRRTHLHQRCKPLVRKSGNAAVGKRTHCSAGILRPEVDRKQGRPPNALRALASGPTRRPSPQSLHRHACWRRAACLPAAALAAEDGEPWVHSPRLLGRAFPKACVRRGGPVYAQRPKKHHRGCSMPRAAKPPHSPRWAP